MKYARIASLAVAGAVAGSVALQAAAPSTGLAAGKRKKAAAPVNGKRVVALEPVRNVRIEMPDGEFHDFGQDFQGALTTKLHQSGRFVVADPPVKVGPMASALSRAAETPPGYQWPGSTVPAATVKVKVEAMSFQTGARGDRMFYGFNERFRTPYNNGYEDLANEFPLRKVSFEPNWFDRHFDKRGQGLFSSQSGLDLGDGFGVDIIFAWLAVKYALYRSELRLRLDIDAPLAGRKEFRTVNVKGEGYFFDVAGAYYGYSAGISVARRDAMDRALKNAIGGAYEAIDRALQGLPLTARLDHVLPDGSLLLGTGRGSDVGTGVRYEVVGNPSLIVEIVSNTSSGSIAKVVQGDPSLFRPEMLLREVIPGLPPVTLARADEGTLVPARVGAETASLKARALASAASEAPAAAEDISLPWIDFPKADLEGLVPYVSKAKAFFKMLAEAVFLPYRIWRYRQYDQVYRAQADEAVEFDGHDWTVAPRDWPSEARRSSWGRQIGLDQAPRMPEGTGPAPAPVVAVIDTGVDYNHWALHGRLWLNPDPRQLPGGGASGRKDYYGWDFISGDAHPFDDGYHGTEVASLVAAVAPEARIMPLKVFNPWGITTSAAIYGAFKYAADHGASIIVCGWSTRLGSNAISQGVAYARGRGALVVAGAGDRGDVISQVASYPASLSRHFDNVLAVTGVDRKDRLVQVSGRYANLDRELVGLAAPGYSIEVANPRARLTTDTSTALAAGIAAGAVARLLADDRALAALPPAAWIERIREESDPVPSLSSAVRGGLRLRVRH